MTDDRAQGFRKSNTASTSTSNSSAQRRRRPSHQSHRRAADTDAVKTTTGHRSPRVDSPRRRPSAEPQRQSIPPAHLKPDGRGVSVLGRLRGLGSGRDYDDRDFFANVDDAGRASDITFASWDLRPFTARSRRHWRGKLRHRQSCSCGCNDGRMSRRAVTAWHRGAVRPSRSRPACPLVKRLADRASNHRRLEGFRNRPIAELAMHGSHDEGKDERRCMPLSGSMKLPKSPSFVASRTTGQQRSRERRYAPSLKYAN